MNIGATIAKLLNRNKYRLPPEAKGDPILEYEDYVGKSKIMLFVEILIVFAITSATVGLFIDTIKEGISSSFSRDFIVSTLSFLFLLALPVYLWLYIVYMFVSLVPSIKIYENGILLRDYSLINRMKKKEPDFIFYDEIIKFETFPHGLIINIYTKEKKYKIHHPMVFQIKLEDLQKLRDDYLAKKSKG